MHQVWHAVFGPFYPSPMPHRTQNEVVFGRSPIGLRSYFMYISQGSGGGVYPLITEWHLTYFLPPSPWCLDLGYNMKPHQRDQKASTCLGSVGNKAHNTLILI